MKSLAGICSVAGLALGLALTFVPAGAQLQAAPNSQGSPAAIAAAKELLAVTGAGVVYAHAVVSIVGQVSQNLLATNLRYQKDLNEVAAIVGQKFAGREKEIGDGWANFYTSVLSEQELVDLVAFYKSPLGRKWLAAEPSATEFVKAYMNDWAQGFGETVNAEFHAEMKKRGKPI